MHYGGKSAAFGRDGRSNVLTVWPRRAKTSTIVGNNATTNIRCEVLIKVAELRCSRYPCPYKKGNIMSPSLNLSETAAVFPCPTCKETVNTSMQLCPFCGAAIDHAAAEASAIETSEISRACSDASYLKIMLGILIPFGALVFFPFLGLAGLVGFVFIKYAVPVMVIRWWIKYGRVKSQDLDLRRARKAVIVVSGVSLLVLLFVHVNLCGLAL